MSTATNPAFTKDAWQNPRNARTLRAYMALRNQEIGGRIRELRGTRPQAVIAEALGVSERAYQTWEHGDAKPSYRSLQKLAEFFGVSESYILEGVDDRPIVEGVPEQLETVEQKFTDMLEEIVASDDENRARIHDRLERLETKMDRLMALISEGLFVSPQPATEDADRRQPQPHREDEIGLAEALTDVFLENPQALQGFRERLRPHLEPAPTERAPSKRQAS